MHDNKWRFLDTGKGSAVFNMALDEALMRMVANGSSPPTFRVYEWESPSITVGYSQDVYDVLDLRMCVDDGIGISKRPTGGRAVFHDDEIAYSVTAPVDDPDFGGSIMETYNRISTMLCEALNTIGVRAVFSRGNTCKKKDCRITKEPCFLSVSRHEITCGGKKLVGSAQRRFRNVFLQQGSILIGPGQGKIAAYCKNRPHAKHLAGLIENRSTNVKTVLGNSFSKDRIKAAFLDTLKETVDAEVVCHDILPEEMQMAKRYEQEYVESIV